jgi:hypothetical protein
MLSVAIYLLCSECHNDKCRHAECHGAIQGQTRWGQANRTGMLTDQKVKKSEGLHYANGNNDVTYNDFTLMKILITPNTGDITYTNITYDNNKCNITCMFFLLL